MMIFSARQRRIKKILSYLEDKEEVLEVVQFGNNRVYRLKIAKVTKEELLRLGAEIESLDHSLIKDLVLVYFEGDSSNFYREMIISFKNSINLPGDLNPSSEKVDGFHVFDKNHKYGGRKEEGENNSIFYTSLGTIFYFKLKK